ncbi:unnamed protein product [Litomosoides sigmodontis]|uniref:Uncharacterized protein n=1 Tax=Litomosoides sigmodontis TaxID=42156 RepID=A0A3P6V160_LITSI|nr:unnamed protein product [Litomosoides sigmodontis]
MKFYNKSTAKQYNTIWRQKTELISEKDEQSLDNRRAGYSKFSPRKLLNWARIKKELPDYSYLNMFGSINLP